MSKGGSETAVQSNTPSGKVWDEQVKHYGTATALADRPYAAYSGPQIAPINWNQAHAGNQIKDQYGFAQMQAASDAAQGAANFKGVGVNAGSANTPQGTVMNTPWASAGDAHLGQAFGTAAASAGPAAQMTAAQAELAQMQAAQMARKDVRDVNAQKFTDANISQYMNPYTAQVIDTTMNQLGRQNNILQNQANAQAAKSGSFGGSRQAVMNAENNRNFMDQVGQTTANLNNQNFAQAQAAIGQDQNRNLTAQQSNQQQDWNVGNLNTTNRQAANLNNMLESNSMSKYNATNRQNASEWNAGAKNNMAQYNASNQMQANRDTSAAQNARETANMNAINSRAEYNTGNQQRSNELTSSAHNDMTKNNMTAQQSANQFNADINLRAQLANQAAQQNAVNTNLPAANSLNGMGLDQQKWNLTNANANLQFGNMLQSQQQREYDLAQQRWADEYNYPLAQLAMKQQALSGMPVSTTKTTTSPTHNNYGANALSGALGAYKLADAMGYGSGGYGAAAAAAGGLLSFL